MSSSPNDRLPPALTKRKWCLGDILDLGLLLQPEGTSSSEFLQQTRLPPPEQMEGSSRPHRDVLLVLALCFLWRTWRPDILWCRRF